MRKIILIAALLMSFMGFSQDNSLGMNSLVLFNRTNAERNAYTSVAGRTRFVFNTDTGQLEYKNGTGPWNTIAMDSIYSDKVYLYDTFDYWTQNHLQGALNQIGSTLNDLDSRLDSIYSNEVFLYDTFDYWTFDNLQGALDQIGNTLQTLENDVGYVPNSFEIDITDSAGYYTGSNVEGALIQIGQELGAITTPGAFQIDVTDTPGYYIADNVEGILTEIGASLGNLSGLESRIDNLDAYDIAIDDIQGNYTGSNAEGAFIQIGQELNDIENDLIPLQVNTTSFDKNLTSGDNTLQLIADKFDEYVPSGDLTDDQTAAQVPFTPYSTITSTNTQSAIEELKNEVDLVSGGSISNLDATAIADGSVSNTEFQYLNFLVAPVQQQLDSKLSNSGGALAGNLSFANLFKVTGLIDPTLGSDAVNLDYLNAQLGNGAVTEHPDSGESNIRFGIGNETEKDAATLGTNDIWVCTNCPASEEIAAGSSILDFAGKGDFIHIDNTTDDITAFEIQNMKANFVIEIYLNQATEPTFTPSIPNEADGTLDWTDDSLADTDVTLTIKLNGKGTYQKVYTKGN
jgi:hypothetical protein